VGIPQVFEKCLPFQAPLKRLLIAKLVVQSTVKEALVKDEDDVCTAQFA